MPRDRMNANSEIKLMDTSRAGMRSSAPRKLMGMPSITQKASRTFMNSPRASVTSVSPR